ncbi:hypothetical protein F6X40_41340 [Paraburkholderia sp. UCT31]|nr:hypothetical protein [Paraburkholderia sp. UCT31]
MHANHKFEALTATATEGRTWQSESLRNGRYGWNWYGDMSAASQGRTRETLINELSDRLADQDASNFLDNESNRRSFR